MNTVLVCDKEPIAIEGLRSLLESEGWCVVAAENSLEDGMDAARQLQPTLMFVDKAFGTEAVMDWVRVLRAEKSPMATIVWGVLPPEAEALRFLRAGAAGVICKTSPLGELMGCIRTVVAGGAWPPPHRYVYFPTSTNGAQ